jgi:DNA processing protein
VPRRRENPDAVAAERTFGRTTPAPVPQAELDDHQRLACLRLVRSENVGPVTFRELINRFGGATAALAALPEISRRVGRKIRICPAERAEAELAAAAKVGAVPLFTIEPGYPRALAFLEHLPPMLYARGDLALLQRPASVAIVGSRDCSAGGAAVARALAAGVGAAGFVVVSGLARGIDAVAHEASLATGTIAVLAGGVDTVYPPEHADLQARIAERGCLVSELPPGYIGRAHDFRQRNRIVSGIAMGVVVVEAARRSGTLITARMAGEQGRSVFAVPGHPLDPRAEGTNNLLKEGATLVTSADDVISALAPQIDGFRMPPADAFEHAMLSPAEPRVPDPPADQSIARVVGVLGPAPVSIDEIVRATGLPARLVQGAVLELTLAGRIERHGSQQVSLRPL